MENKLPHEHMTVDESAYGEDQLITVFENGKLLVDHSLADIKQRLA